MPSRDFTKERQHFEGGWAVWYNPDAVKKRWIAEHPGPPRIRDGHPTMEDAIAQCAGTQSYALNGVVPVNALKGQRQLILQQLAVKLETASEPEVQGWNSLVALDAKTINVLYKISSTMVECKDLHRAEELVIKVLESLRSTRTHVTIGFLVPTFLQAHLDSPKAHKTEDQKKRAMAYHNQLVKVGNFMALHFGKDFDIDDLDQKKVDAFKSEYAKEFPTVQGKLVVDTTLNVKGRLFNQFLNHAHKPLGWTGKFRVPVLDLNNSNGQVALNFHELSGMIIGLHYTDPVANRAFLIEVFGCAQFIEIKLMKWLNVHRPSHQIRIAGDATKATSVLSQRGAEGNPNNVGKEHDLDVIDALFQWLTFYQATLGETGDTVWSMSYATFNKRINTVRELADVLRWSEKDGGRHTGINILRKWGIPHWKTQDQAGHDANSRVTRRSYFGEIKDEDACAAVLITPYYLGLIPEPYPYVAPAQGHLLHLGHHLQLCQKEPVHQAVMQKHLPLLEARHAEVKRACRV